MTVHRWGWLVVGVALLIGMLLALQAFRHSRQPSAVPAWTIPSPVRHRMARIPKLFAWAYVWDAGALWPWVAPYLHASDWRTRWITAALVEMLGRDMHVAFLQTPRAPGWTWVAILTPPTVATRVLPWAQRLAPSSWRWRTAQPAPGCTWARRLHTSPAGAWMVHQCGPRWLIHPAEDASLRSLVKDVTAGRIDIPIPDRDPPAAGVVWLRMDRLPKGFPLTAEIRSRWMQASPFSPWVTVLVEAQSNRVAFYVHLLRQP